MLSKSELYAQFKKSNLAPKVFARLMKLKNKSSLYAYMSGDEPISKRLERNFREWQTGYKQSGIIIARIEIPDGTILPSNAIIKQCDGCHCKFITMNSRRRFHSHACQCRAWRKSKKTKVASTGER